MKRSRQVVKAKLERRSIRSMLTAMPLSRDEVLAGALRLLDADGLDALTMRRLAESLGVRAGAIYWHFADKQDLYDAMVEKMLAPILDQPLRGRWEQQIAEVSRRLAAALGGHRDGARLATLSLRPGPKGLEVSERMLRIVRDAGFSQRATLWATSVLGYFILGYVTDVQALQSAKARGLDAVLRAFTKELDRERFPELGAFSDEKKLAGIMSPRELRGRFEFGLKVILTGLAATRRRPRTTTRRRARR
jgi:TetR/AcrR family tetracycline transcriptional repressor